MGCVPNVATKRALSNMLRAFFIVPGTEQADRFSSLVRKIEKAVGLTEEPIHLPCRRELVAKLFFSASRAVLISGRPFFVAAGCQIRGILS